MLHVVAGIALFVVIFVVVAAVVDVALNLTSRWRRGNKK